MNGYSGLATNSLLSKIYLSSHWYSWLGPGILHHGRGWTGYSPARRAGPREPKYLVLECNSQILLLLFFFFFKDPHVFACLFV